MLSIDDKNQKHFIHDLYPADYIYDTAGCNYLYNLIYIAAKYGFIKVSSKIMLNLFQIQINVHVI